MSIFCSAQQKMSGPKATHVPCTGITTIASELVFQYKSPFGKKQLILSKNWCRRRRQAPASARENKKEGLANIAREQERKRIGSDRHGQPGDTTQRDGLEALGENILELDLEANARKRSSKEILAQLAQQGNTLRAEDARSIQARPPRTAR